MNNYFSRIGEYLFFNTLFVLLTFYVFYYVCFIVKFGKINKYFLLTIKSFVRFCKTFYNKKLVKYLRFTKKQKKKKKHSSFPLNPHLMAKPPVLWTRLLVWWLGNYKHQFWWFVLEKLFVTPNTWKSFSKNATKNILHLKDFTTQKKKKTKTKKKKKRSVKWRIIIPYQNGHKLIIAIP